MAHLDYSSAGVTVRDGLRSAHRDLWEHLRAAGTWWSGATRVAIAAEGRHAVRCTLCRRRREALSPAAARGTHETLGALSPSLVEVIHRVRTDSGRLTREWFERVVDQGLTDAEYVEIVGVVAMLAGVDFFARALGIEPFPLPEPLSGEPSRRRPAAARRSVAWVPTIAPEDAVGPEADVYGGGTVVPNIVRALSLVPDEVRMLRRLSDAHYLPIASISDPTARRALGRMQMELVAARVSALNECFY
jgi:alkylhydroperoxidase family enzyme